VPRTRAKQHLYFIYPPIHIAARMAIPSPSSRGFWNTSHRILPHASLSGENEISGNQYVVCELPSDRWGNGFRTFINHVSTILLYCYIRSHSKGRNSAIYGSHLVEC